VAQSVPGTGAKITLLRGKKEIQLTVKVGELEGEKKVAKGGNGADVLGVKVEKVTQDLANKIGLRRATGVLITQVEPGSAAEQAKLVNGDIVFRVGNREVSSPNEFYSLVSEAAKEGEVMLLLRDGESGRVGYMVVPLR
jgi:serine protease Do